MNAAVLTVVMAVFVVVMTAVLVVVLGGRLSLVAAKRALVDLVRMYARPASGSPGRREASEASTSKKVLDIVLV